MLGSAEERLSKQFWVYLLANRKNGTLYCGHTNDLAKRIFAHREGRGSAFTKKYSVTRLVWCEPHMTREAAKSREYRIKAWNRAWKIKMIEEDNPDWGDLYLRLNQ
jgi:putative endonuclease